jgi:hypothetical protein
LTPLFCGELSGSRVIQIGVGTSDCTASDMTPVLFDATTQDLFPADGGASVMFTQLNVTIRHSNGFTLGVTPLVDGRADPEQTFMFSGAPAGVDGIETVKAPFRLRGERVACRVRQLAATDVVELVDIAVTFVPIRSSV